MSDDEQNIRESEIRQQVTQRVNERVEVYIHATVFVVAIVGMWVFWLLRGGWASRFYGLSLSPLVGEWG